MGWETSNRKSRLPSDWARIRADVKARAAGRCEYVGRAGRCVLPGTDCDHIVRGDDHSLANLQWLCKKHHAIKSSREGGSAPRKKKKRKNKLAGWNKEKHPGYA